MLQQHDNAVVKHMCIFGHAIYPVYEITLLFKHAWCDAGASVFPQGFHATVLLQCGLKTKRRRQGAVLSNDQVTLVFSTPPVYRQSYAAGALCRSAELTHRLR